MRLLFRLGLLCALAAPLVHAPSAHASVSLAAVYDTLVGTADAVLVVTPVESKSQWEDGKIYTYTRVRVDSSVAGDVGAGSETWIRTRGGVVGKIGQNVDGEAVFTNTVRSLVFVRRGPSSTFEVSARGQGQYPIATDEKSGRSRLVRSVSVGVLFPPRRPQLAAPISKSSSVTPQAQASNQSEVPPVTATEVLHNRPLEEAVRKIAEDYKRLHKAP